MLTTMTTAENLGITNILFAHPRLSLVGVRKSCFKMKSNEILGDGGSSPLNSEDQQVADLLERFGLTDIDYDDDCDTESEWSFPETECTERASRHLSGGGILVESCTTPTIKSLFNGRTTPCDPTPFKSSQEIPASHCTNPFKNHMRLVLEAEEEDSTHKSSENFDFCATNPFSKLNESSLDDESCPRTFSQCPTRAVSPLSVESPTTNFLTAVGRPSSFIFAMPAPSTVSQATQTSNEAPWLLRNQSEYDLQCLQKSIKALQMSGWYFENVSLKESIVLLQYTEPGTFLVRDSADPNFLFTLSLQTIRGPTSVRLHYVHGQFRLDAEPQLIPNIPFFDSVIELVEHYIANTKGNKSIKTKGKAKEQVWVDVHGQVYSNILLSKPLLKTGQIPKLQHLCRLQVNSMLRCNYLHRHEHIKTKSKVLPNVSVPMISLIDSLKMPQSIKDFLREYPFSK